MIIDNHTICAPATNPGGALEIIRISGPQTLEILSRIFHITSTKYPPSTSCSEDHDIIKNLPANTIHHGIIHTKEGDILDDVLVSIFRAPHSYTGEDAAEISCHGSRYITNKVLELLIQHGCRMADPGEYTQRAYLNGKMDLSQAEAVADLIASTNAATHKMAMSQLRGNFSSDLSSLREQLLKMTSLLELELDFSDHEDLEFADRSELLELAKDIDGHISKLTHSFETGNAVKQGIPVAIVGKTNVGKSTLLNRFLHEEKAIVSSIHGTTRDIIEDSIQINGITFRFIDTAGLRSTDDEIEQIGIERAYQKMHEANIILWVVEEIPNYIEINTFKSHIKTNTLIIVKNKIDLYDSLKEQTVIDSVEDIPIIPVSAKYNTNIDRLEEYIFQTANIPVIHQNDVIVTSARHYQALLHAQEDIKRVISGLQNNLSGDLLAEDLNLCIEQLSAITGGAITPEETLQNIFSHFCIGK